MNLDPFSDADASQPPLPDLGMPFEPTFVQPQDFPASPYQLDATNLTDFDEAFESLFRIQNQTIRAEVAQLERLRDANMRTKAQGLFPDTSFPGLLTANESDALQGFLDDFLEETPRTETEPKAPRRRLRKRLLSEQEKRLNHTSSEKKRRLLIKTSFEELVARLPLDDLRRKQDGKKGRALKMSKFVVLDTASREIELLMDVNRRLKELAAATD